MIEPRPDARHLSDADIDAYWQRTLPPDAEAQFEQHYLDCRECWERVHTVEALLEAREDAATAVPPSTRSLRTWQAVAAGLAVIAIVTALPWTSPIRPTPSTAAPPDPVATSPAPPSMALNVVTLSLAPATRDSAPATFQVPDDASVVIVVIDAREVAPPGARVDVALVAPSGDHVLSARRLATTEGGAVRVPLDSSLLERGQFMFEVSTGSSSLAVPLRVQRSSAQ